MNKDIFFQNSSKESHISFAISKKMEINQKESVLFVVYFIRKEINVAIY